MSWTLLILTTLAALGPLLLLAPTVLFAVGVGLAVLFPRQRHRPLVNSPPQTAILIPAHNEAAGLGKMLQALRTTLRGDERIVVVADNCTDLTAEVARQAGVAVLERTNLQERGKGHALAYGITHIKQWKQPPQVLVVLDADCEVSPDAVARLAYEAERRARPIQGLYLCQAPQPLQPKTALSAMAFQFKNHLRPLGMHVLGGSAYLTGSGMALPWEVIDRVHWASGNVVEDMQLGLDYARAGLAPAFFDGAQIYSPLPTDDKVANTQRTRWEHGHLKTLFGQCPGLVWQALSKCQPGLLLLALDLAIPPLALLASLWMIAFTGALTLAVGAHVWWPTWVVMAEGFLLGSAVLSGWIAFCRQTVPAQMLLRIPGYVWGKVGIYASYLRRPQQQWVRTQRAGE